MFDITPLAFYLSIVIKSFRDKKTEAVWLRQAVRGMAPELHRAARRKLVMLDAATCPDDLRMPPGNRLETLSGDRKGQYSIRINRQYRICFRWDGNDAHDVEIVDYH